MDEQAMDARHEAGAAAVVQDPVAAKGASRARQRVRLPTVQMAPRMTLGRHSGGRRGRQHQHQHQHQHRAMLTEPCLRRAVSSGALGFVQGVNAIANQEAREGAVERRHARAQSKLRAAERLRLRREQNHLEAVRRDTSTADEKLIYARRKKAITREMFRLQALQNGFDLENFSYKPDPQLRRTVSTGVMPSMLAAACSLSRASHLRDSVF